MSWTVDLRRISGSTVFRENKEGRIFFLNKNFKLSSINYIQFFGKQSLTFQEVEGIKHAFRLFEKVNHGRLLLLRVNTYHYWLYMTQYCLTI